MTGWGRLWLSWVTNRGVELSLSVRAQRSEIEAKIFILRKRRNPNIGQIIETMLEIRCKIWNIKIIKKNPIFVLFSVGLKVFPACNYGIIGEVRMLSWPAKIIITWWVLDGWLNTEYNDTKLDKATNSSQHLQRSLTMIAACSAP